MRKLMVMFLGFVFVLSAAAMADEKTAVQEKNGSGISTNDTLKVILTRRSIRKFTDEQVSDADLKAIIQAGLFAPTGMGKQPWHITVIQDKKILDRMTERFIAMAKKSGKGPAAKDSNFRIFYGAPTGIVVSAENGQELAPIDCAAMVENMLIAAESLGLGAGWEQMNMPLFEGEEGKELVKEIAIPDGFKPIYTFALGHKAEHPEPHPRREGTVNYVK